MRSVLSIRLWLLIACLPVVVACQEETIKPSENTEQPTSQNSKKAKLEAKTASNTQLVIGNAKVDRRVIPDVAPVVPKRISHKSVVDSYQKALASVSDPMIKARIERRLAGLAMMESEELQVRGETIAQQKQAMNKFDATIKAYQKYLEDYPKGTENDKVYYQLAKAYGLKGQIAESDQYLNELIKRYPNSPLAAEGYYRRAEYYYSNKQYREAGQSYQKVIDLSDNDKLKINARYMKAWAQFKRSNYQDSLDEFTVLLDNLAPSKSVYSSLNDNQKALIEDAFRAMSYAFSYMDAGRSVIEHFENTGERHYESLVFSALGLLYQSKERYQDAADVYLAYINRHPLAEDGPEVYARVVKVYELGRFPSVVIPAKADYATRYAVASPWHKAQSQVPEKHTTRLKKYMRQLAAYYHTRGQKEKKKQNLRDSYFAQAINWYKSYIRDFPQEADVADKYVRLGEVYTLTNKHALAAQSYLKAAYDYPDYQVEMRANSGYSAIVAFQTIAKVSGEEKDQREKISQSKRFAEAFANDKRAIPVMVDASESLLKLNEYVEAEKAARSVVVKLITSGSSEYAVDDKTKRLQWQPYSTRRYRRSAWIVVAHSTFELGNYEQAENGYTQAIKLMKKPSKLKSSLRQRLAISIYRQGELFAKDGDNEKALATFERVLVKVPEADIKVQTQYDITAQHLILEQWKPAVTKLKAFRKAYPDHKLTPGIRDKLIYAYEKDERWSLAADELTSMSNDESVEQDQRRIALFQAAEYYERDKAIVKAIDRYRSYAHGYPKPFTVNLETQHKLATLYQTRNETNKRKYWLKKIIANDKSAGDQRSARSQYLAASASYELASDDWQVFKRTKLTLPLNRSIKKKQKAMQTVINKYTAVADYGVEEYQTAATHRIAEAYLVMSKDLMNSQRPKGLNDLELEQYDILLEEQAYPFEETSISVFETNTIRTKDGVYDQWVKQSFDSLAQILPARYGKEEIVEGYSDFLE